MNAAFLGEYAVVGNLKIIFTDSKKHFLRAQIRNMPIHGRREVVFVRQHLLPECEIWQTGSRGGHFLFPSKTASFPIFAWRGQRIAHKINSNNAVDDHEAAIDSELLFDHLLRSLKDHLPSCADCANVLCYCVRVSTSADKIYFHWNFVQNVFKEDCPFIIIKTYTFKKQFVMLPFGFSSSALNSVEKILDINQVKASTWFNTECVIDVSSKAYN